MKTLQDLSEKYSDMLIKGGADPQNAYKYKYGFESGISTLLVFILIMLGGIILKKPIDMLCFFISWVVVRRFVGGLHAQNHISCTVISVIMSVLSIMSVDYLKMLSPIVLVISVWLCTILFYFVAPIINVKQGKVSVATHRKARIKSIVFCTIFSVALSFTLFYRINHSVPVLCGYILTAILAIPGYFSKTRLRIFY